MEHLRDCGARKMLTKDELVDVIANIRHGTPYEFDNASKHLIHSHEEARGLLVDILFWHSLLPHALVDAIRAALGEDDADEG